MSKRTQIALVGLVCLLLGFFMAQPLPLIHAQTASKGPKWSHALELKVRKAGEVDFTNATKMIGLEVFRDENNGNLIYVAETGSIAVVAGK
jgi:hypothetical protein